MAKRDPLRPHEPIYSVQEAANIKQVHPATIRRWIDRGWLRATKPGRDFEIRHSDLMACDSRPNWCPDSRVSEIVRATQ